MADKFYKCRSCKEEIYFEDDPPESEQEIICHPCEIVELKTENQSLKAELRRERECVDTSLKELAQYENISFYVWIQSNPNCIPSEKAENYLKLARQTQALRKIKLEDI